MIRTKPAFGPALTALLVAAMMTVALAHPAHAASRAHSAGQLHKVESALGAKHQRAAALAGQAQQAAADLKDLRQRLIAATRALQQKEAEQQKLEDRLADLESEIESRNAALAGTKARLATLATALLRFGRQPALFLLLPQSLAGDPIDRAMLLRALLPRLEDQAERAAHNLEVLEQLRRKAARQKKTVAAARRLLAAQQNDLDRLVALRQGALKQTEAEKQAIARQLVSLTNEARDLRDLLARVAPRARYRGRGLAPALVWPVAGTVVRGFGAKDKAGIVSRGLTFTAPAGSPVVAPAAGRVVFAGPFRGYGQILIMQHKDGYHSLLAGFGRIDADVGQDIAAGEPLGTLPDGAGRRPQLYFEWRHDGAPTDPMEGHTRRAADSR
ncbi:MAG TPA: peptidoglycan DD-metalloendopeptidase family protein [Alphaproteobacteria bacterium]|nr:peptidoglycan DD-metalloendopeptidase family protein [Alphaproteobacteria bacterium]